MNKTLAALLAGLIGSAAAIAADPPKTYDPAEVECRHFDDADVSRMVARLDSVDQLLPQTPPEEDRYLQAESAAIRRGYDQPNRGDPENRVLANRSLTMESRPLYRVWRVRQRLPEARNGLTKILAPEGRTAYRTNSEAEKLQRATSALIAMQAYESAVGSLVGQPQSFVTTDQMTQILVSGSTYDLVSFIRCKLAKIMGRQNL